MIFGVDKKPSLAEALVHFGVKGMQWGVRRDPRNVASRAADRAARRKFDQERNAEIDAARTRVRSGVTRSELKDAKRQFKTDKSELGRREARKKLYAARLKAQNDRDTANMIKSGAETAGAILGIVGGTVLSARLRP